jgi:hypothetical protein
MPPSSGDASTDRLGTAAAMIACLSFIDTSSHEPT